VQGRWLWLSSIGRARLHPDVHEKRDMGEAVVTGTGRERLGGTALTKRWEDDDARRLQTRELSEPGGLYTGARMVGGSRLGQPTRAQCLAIERPTGGAHTVVFPYSRIKPENRIQCEKKR
jgi:hypothetical protein